jgi:hypothetical protein
VADGAAFAVVSSVANSFHYLRYLGLWTLCSAAAALVVGPILLDRSSALAEPSRPGAPALSREYVDAAFATLVNALGPSDT